MRRFAVAVAGLAVGALAFVLTFFRVSTQAPHLAPRVPWSALVEALSSLRPGFMLLFAAVNLTSLPLRALQLQAIARRADGSAPPFAPCFRAVAVGVLTHMLLPARLGEAARALVLTRDGGVSLPRSASALLVGRAFDLLAILVMSCALPSLLALRAASLPSLRAVTIGGSLLAALLLAAIVALRLGGDGIARALGRRWAAAGRVAGEFADGLAAISDGKRLGVAVPSSLAVVAALAASNEIALRASAIAAPSGASLVLTGLFLVGVAVPGAPSSLGTYHAVVALTLVALGVPPAQALGFAIATHAVGTLANILVGAAAVAMLRKHDER